VSSITRQNIGKYTYIYESESYWDTTNKRPDNNKTRIGKIDRRTGEPVYVQEYLDRLAARGESTEGMRLWNREKGDVEQVWGGLGGDVEIAKAIVESVKDFGVVYFLKEVAEKNGLLGVLRDAMREVWQEVFCLACYLVAADKPVMYCEEWVASNNGLEVGSMSSQRISDLLTAFGYAERNNFYRAWHKLIREREYIALDITSVSSYSGQIGACEWGYNRDGENLPQINIMMLVGEESRLPVYQAVYDGSLNDVKTLKTAIKSFGHITGGKAIIVVMDKGFYSAENINAMLNVEWPVNFVIAAPFKSKLTETLVESARDGIDDVENVIVIGNDSMRGMSKVIAWGDHNIYAHIYFSPLSFSRSMTAQSVMPAISESLDCISPSSIR